MCTCVRTHMGMHAYVRVGVRAYACVRACACECECEWACECTYACMRMCVCGNLIIHTSVHVRVHVPAHVRLHVPHARCVRRGVARHGASMRLSAWLLVCVCTYACVRMHANMLFSFLTVGAVCGPEEETGGGQCNAAGGGNGEVV